MDKDQSEEYPILTIYWEENKETRTQIYKGYLPYIFGFSPDGEYYVHADDGGLIVLKRNSYWFGKLIRDFKMKGLESSQRKKRHLYVKIVGIIPLNI